MEHFIENGESMSNWDWAEAVFNMDVNALTNSDIVIAIYDKHYSDSGTAWELGLAYGLGIPIFLLCTDLNSDNSIMPLVAADEIYDFNKFINGEYFDVDKSKLQNLK
jgi:nucleoside 2-deoxyribosyltransferase